VNINKRKNRKEKIDIYKIEMRYRVDQSSRRRE